MTTRLEASSGYRWVILGAVFLAQGGAAMAAFSFGPLAPFLRDAFNITRAEVGLLSSLVFLAILPFGLAAGWLIDRFGVRRLLLLGPGTFGVLYALLSQSPNVQIVYVVVFFAGMGYVFVTPTTTKAVLGWFPLENRATAVSIKQSALTVGAAIGAVAIPSLALALGWRNAVAIVGMVAVAVAVLSSAVYRRSPEELSEAGVGLGQIRLVLGNRQLLLLGLLGGVYIALQVSLTSYLVLYLTEVRLFSAVLAGTFLMVANLAGAFGRVGWGVISDRAFGGRRRPVMTTIGVISAAMALVMTFASATMPEWLLYLTVILFGATAIGYNGVFLTFAIELSGRELAATGLGWVLALSVLGGFIGPPLFGYIVDRTSSYGLAWVVFGLLTAVAAACMMLIREHKRQA